MFHKLMVQRLLQPMVLVMDATARHARRDLRIVKNRREVEPAGFPMLYRRLHVKPVHATNHLVDRPETELRHVLPYLLGDEEKEIDDVLGLSFELRT